MITDGSKGDYSTVSDDYWNLHDNSFEFYSIEHMVEHLSKVNAELNRKVCKFMEQVNERNHTGKAVFGLTIRETMVADTSYARILAMVNAQKVKE